MDVTRVAKKAPLDDASHPTRKREGGQLFFLAVGRHSHLRMSALLPQFPFFFQLLIDFSRCMP
jgi:hypothetical protein